MKIKPMSSQSGMSLFEMMFALALVFSLLVLLAWPYFKKTLDEYRDFYSKNSASNAALTIAKSQQKRYADLGNYGAKFNYANPDGSVGADILGVALDQFSKENPGGQDTVECFNPASGNSHCLTRDGRWMVAVRGAGPTNANDEDGNGWRAGAYAACSDLMAKTGNDLSNCSKIGNFSAIFDFDIVLAPLTEASFNKTPYWTVYGKGSLTPTMWRPPEEARFGAGAKNWLISNGFGNRSNWTPYN